MLNQMGASTVKILLVEDDHHIRQQLVAAFSETEFLVENCCTLAEARAVSPDSFALILLDLGLPDGDGLALCRELRESGDQTPVIILTARKAPDQRVSGLEAGADDYLAKPFHMPELIARIRAVLRRSAVHEDVQRLNCGALWLDPTARKVGIGERLIEVKRREFELLQFLMRYPGRTWTRSQLLTRVWERNFVGEERTVDIHVGRLRARIEEDARRPKRLQTVWGVGYRMSEQD